MSDSLGDDDQLNNYFYSFKHVQKIAAQRPLHLLAASQMKEHIQVVAMDGGICWIKTREYESWRAKGLDVIELVRARLPG